MTIKGIDILLYDGDEAETISNVLVGEPATADSTEVGSTQILGYTLAIPKGDTHVWADRIVEFFDRKFRTVGYPQVGIEENIPLAWHKKVKVQILNISGSLTVYEKDTFVRHLVSNAFFYDGRGQVTQKGGTQITGDVKARIYGTFGQVYKPKVGDILVTSNCPFEFDDTSQKALSEDFAQFRREYPDFAVISVVTPKMCGTNPDYELTAR